MDAVSKRRIVAAIYVLFWGLKLNSLFSQSPSAAIGSWCFLDFIFFIGLLRFQIPWITLSRLSTFIIIISACILNIGMIGGYTKQSPFLKPILTENTQIPKIIKPNYAIDKPPLAKNNYIHGSHIVHVRQPALAKLNPDNVNYCSINENSPQFIPILIKGIPPWNIDLEFQSLNGTKSILQNIHISEKNLHDLNIPLIDSKISTRLYTFQISEYGIYTLLNIKQSNGDLGKVSKNSVELVKCPRAIWNINNKIPIDGCINDQIELKILTSGIPPLKIWILKQISDISETIVTLDVENSRENTNLTSRLDLIQNYEIKTDFLLKIMHPQRYFLQIMRISDGRNNTIDYSHNSTLNELLKTPIGASYHKSNEIGDYYAITGRSLPHASFFNCANLKIKMDESGMNAFDPAHLSMAFSGNGEWSVTFGRVDSNDHEKITDLQQIGNIKVSTPRVSIAVNFPGTYIIQSIEDKYCKGSVIQPSSCSIVGTIPPTLKVSSAPIESSCAGAIGITANLSFTGEPPFWVEVEHEWGEEVNRERYSNLKSRHLLRFEPKEHGRHRYTFISVGDLQYPEGSKVRVPPISQIVHAQPSARLVSREKITKCIGDSVLINAILEGSGPWTLSYEIMHGNEKSVNVISEITQESIDLNIPDLQKSGSYVISLNEIKDSNGCVKSLFSEDVTIQVLAQRPTASFACDAVVKYLEGSRAPLPISLNGFGTFEVKFIDLKHPNNEHKMDVSHKAFTLGVEVPGTYQLISIKDKYCTGVVVEPKRCEGMIIDYQINFTASLIARPTFHIDESPILKGISSNLIRRPVCQDFSDSLKIRMSGKPPFNIFFSHNYTSMDAQQHIIDGEKIISDLEDHEGMPYAEIILETRSAGLHRYEFTSISDQNYKTPTAFDKKWAVEQQVFASPEARFIDTQDKVFQCLSDVHGETSLSIQISGTPPLILTLSQRHDNSDPEIISRTISASDIKFENGINIYEFDPGYLRAIGKYSFSLLTIADGNSCETRLESQSKMVIHVADQAKIISNNPPVVCVGDMLSYSLQGTPPFTIGYTWNNKPVSDLILQDPILSLFAYEAGTVVINKVCNAMGCCNKNLQGLETTVMKLPSAYVNGGEDLIEDIKEGDESTMTIEFDGEPPFKVSWTRKQMDDSDSTSSDSFTESDIMSKKFTVKTSQEGIFEVTAIQDKYCGYPRTIQNSEYANSILKN